MKLSFLRAKCKKACKLKNICLFWGMFFTSMSKIIFALLSFVFFSACVVKPVSPPNSPVSNTPADTKIAIVDIQLIESKSHKVEMFRKHVEEKQSKYQERVRAMETEVLKKTEDLKSRASVLSSDKIKQEEDKIKKKIEEYSADAQGFSMAIEAAKSYGIIDLNKCLWTEVEKFSETHQIDAVFPASSVMYVSKNIQDITDEILKTIDKSHCKIDAKEYFKKAEHEIEKAKKDVKHTKK